MGTVSELINKLNDQDEKTRKEAAKELGKVKAAEAVEPLIKALKDESADVKIAAAGALGAIRDDRAIEPLIEALYDEELFMETIGTFHPSSSYAAEALKEIGEPAVLPLVNSWPKSSCGVEYHILYTLGEVLQTVPTETILDNKEAVSTILEMLNSGICDDFPDDIELKEKFLNYLGIDE